MSFSRWRNICARYEKVLLLLAGALIALGITLGHASLAPRPPRITQQDIDAAVLRTLQTRPVPSPAVRAYQAVRASIVRVRADGPRGSGTATGVVIVERGVILTSLHAVSSASRVRVMFEEGLEADATIVTAQPENDLAVLQAAQVPDDLKAATLRSSKKLVEGEQVTAIGFPFGIGPSVSAGVISGLKREYASPDGQHNLHDLIQFDAATNPGSSGGPLLNSAGEVIGIITAILAPGDKGAFAGIAFAVPIETAASGAGLPPF
jgi:S1-C subfamily serine protease